MSHLRRICCLIASTTFLNSAGAGTLVQFRTVFGDMEVELYDQDKPVTVQNFLNYSKAGASRTNLHIVCNQVLCFKAAASP